MKNETEIKLAERHQQNLLKAAEINANELVKKAEIEKKMQDNAMKFVEIIITGIDIRDIVKTLLTIEALLKVGWCVCNSYVRR